MFRDDASGKYGYRQGASGAVVIAAQFDAAFQFSDGLAAVLWPRAPDGTVQGYGFIDTTGRVVYAPQFFNCAFEGNCRFNNGVARVCRDFNCTGYIYFNKTGQQVAGP